ncbi:MAG: hypothetical protein RDV41_15790, partial [Planctomycetota bacterium]|nr:hypothetical protein [Planctomycetota bacterium]
VTLSVLVIGIVVMTVQISLLGNDIDRLDDQIKKLSGKTDATKGHNRTAQEAADRLEAQQEAERLAMKDAVDRLSEQLDAMNQKIGGLDSAVVEVKTSFGQMAQAPAAGTEEGKLSSMLVPSEKEALKSVIREELEDGNKKQTQILMDLFGNRLLDRLARELNLSDQQRTQIDGILRESMQNTMRMWNEGTAKNAGEAQAGMGVVMAETNEKIKNVLTTDQNAKYDQMVQQGMGRMRRVEREATDPPPEGGGQTY